MIQGMNTGMHIEHCCLRHGCKYGEPECPVTLCIVRQELACEQCEADPLAEVPVILVSAPYRMPTVDKLRQLQHVDEVCALLVALGALPIAAHCNSRSHEAMQSSDWWFKAYCALLRKVDAVYFDVGWRESVGCQQEHLLARQIQKPQLMSIPEVKRWVDDYKFLVSLQPDQL